MKEAAYKGLVRPVLEYGSSVWDPHTHGLQEELEKVQNRATRGARRQFGTNLGLHIHYKVMWCGVGVFVGRVPNTVLEPKLVP